MAKTKKLKNMV